MIEKALQARYGDQSLRYAYPLASGVVEQSTDATQRIVTLQTNHGFSVCFAVPREQQSPLGEALMAQSKSSVMLRVNSCGEFEVPISLRRMLVIGTSNSKPHSTQKPAGAPLIPKFANDGAAISRELRNRCTSLPVLAGVMFRDHGQALISEGRFMRAWLLAILMAMVWPAAAADIRVLAAGSLKDPLVAIFADYAKRYGATFSAEWGPSGVLRERLQAGEPFDVFASAALPHAQALTDAGLAGPSVIFARNTLCVVTGAERPYDSGNLVETMLDPGVRIGTSTPTADPAGDYTWEMFHKIDVARPGAFAALSTKAQQLVGGRTNSAPVNGRSRLLIALDDKRIDLFIGYCSGAQQIVREQPNYKSIALPPELSVGPEYGLTVSRKARPDAADFAMYLLSPQGQQSLQAFGFIPVTLPAAP